MAEAIDKVYEGAVESKLLPGIAAIAGNRHGGYRE